MAERTYLRRLLTAQQRAVLDPDVRINPSDPHLRQWLIALHNTGGYTVVIDPEAARKGYQPETEWETWGDVADRVAYGNASLLNLPGHNAGNDNEPLEREELATLIAKGAVLMSGRHLQHGDQYQIERGQEVAANCLAGCTKIATLEYGAIKIEDLVGLTVTVIAGDGEVRPAFVRNHGLQDVQQIGFRATSGGSGKLRHIVRATPNHTWYLRGGTPSCAT